MNFAPLELEVNFAPLELEMNFAPLELEVNFAACAPTQNARAEHVFADTSSDVMAMPA